MDAAMSKIEELIVNSAVPVEVNESAQVTVNGETGTYLNKKEVEQWRGDWPISQYQVDKFR